MPRPHNLFVVPQLNQKSLIGSHDGACTLDPAQCLLERHALGVSSATIRNDMAVLEDEADGFWLRFDLPAGSYVFRLSGGALGTATGRFDIR